MKTENKVISYELAKKIWETARKKGVELPKSEWWWVDWGSGEYVLCFTGRVFGHREPDEEEIRKNAIDFIPAYDVAELLEMLPDENFYFSLLVGKQKKKFWGGYFIFGKDLKKEVFHSPIFRSKFPAQALGKLLLYLLENDLWKGKKEK